ncbi:MAG: hypothetical protein ACK559_34100, partial [bacterium]
MRDHGVLLTLRAVDHRAALVVDLQLVLELGQGVDLPPIIPQREADADLSAAPIDMWQAQRV